MSEDTFDTLISAYPPEMQYALAILQDMQNTCGYVPRDGLEAAASYLNCPVSHLYSMVTFYKALSLKPRGKHLIRVCDGTACHIKKSIDMAEFICSELGIRPGDTTEDGMFTLELVNCLGTCALAPVMLVDTKYYGNLTRKKLRTILASYRGDDKK